METGDALYGEHSAIYDEHMALFTEVAEEYRVEIETKEVE